METEFYFLNRKYIFYGDVTMEYLVGHVIIFPFPLSGVVKWARPICWCRPITAQWAWSRDQLSSNQGRTSLTVTFLYSPPSQSLWIRPCEVVDVGLGLKRAGLATVRLDYKTGKFAPGETFQGNNSGKRAGFLGLLYVESTWGDAHVARPNCYFTDTLE